MGSLAVMDRRGRELRYLTGHYHELQGLRMAPAWAALLVLLAWLGRSRLSLALLCAFSLVWFAMKWDVWATGWYERRYGVVWTAHEGEDEPSKMISLLHGEDEDAAARIRGRIRLRWMASVLIPLAFLLPGFWLHGAQGPAGVISLAMSLAPAYYLGPVLLGPTGGCALAIRRWIVYAAAVLALLGGNLLYLSGRVKDVWALVMVAGVMLVVSLHDHWLFTWPLGGAKARGGHDE